jgi:hypothetical protein
VEEFPKEIAKPLNQRLTQNQFSTTAWAIVLHAVAWPKLAQI